MAKVDFIEKLKTKLESINFEKIFVYEKTSTESLLKVKDLDLIKDVKKVKHLIEKVEENQSMATQIPLFECYQRGFLYRLIQLKFDKKEEFLSYFQDYLNISRQSVYNCVHFCALVDSYPAILATGFSITELFKERKKIIEAAASDLELHKLLSKPYPGIKTNIELRDPNFEIPDEISSQFREKLFIKDKESEKHIEIGSHDEESNDEDYQDTNE